MRVRMIVSFGVVLVVLLLALIPGAAVSPTGWTVVAWNNLGMHCMDADFGVFAILPPYNTIQAHVVDASGHLVKSPARVSVTYEHVADPTGAAADLVRLLGVSVAKTDVNKFKLILASAVFIMVLLAAGFTWAMYKASTAASIPRRPGPPMRPPEPQA